MTVLFGLVTRLQNPGDKIATVLTIAAAGLVFIGGMMEIKVIFSFKGQGFLHAVHNIVFFVMLFAAYIVVMLVVSMVLGLLFGLFGKDAAHFGEALVAGVPQREELVGTAPVHPTVRVELQRHPGCDAHRLVPQLPARPCFGPGGLCR